MKRLALVLLALCGCSQNPPKEPVVQTVVEAPASPTPPREVLALTADAPLALPVLSEQAGQIQRAFELARVEEWERALEKLEGRTDAVARYARAAIWRARGQAQRAEQELSGIQTEEPLASWVKTELGLAAADRGDEQAALRALDAVWGLSPAIDRRIALPLATLRAEQDPESLWSERDALSAALDPDDVDARSAFYGALLRSLERAPRDGVSAEALALERYLSEPVSVHTPSEPPRPLTPEERIERAEALLDEHRNERVDAELRPISALELPVELACRRDFIAGFAARKLRHYRTAREYLERVVEGECDRELRRRAHYLWAKVVSIANGLAAIEPIERFATEFQGHSMVDDVYFWAGDMYQRRGRREDAERYYRKIESMSPPGDQCAIARWRLAWMSYEAREWQKATQRLERLLLDDGCVRDAFETARATYWLGRIAERRGRTAESLEHFSDVLSRDPMGWYAQLALGRVRALDSKRFAALAPKAPKPEGLPALCPGKLASDPAFRRGFELRAMGLTEQAAAEWLTVNVAETAVLSGAHAAALAEEAKPLEVAEAKALESTCSADHPGLLLALALATVGEKAEAQWRLRTTHAEYLARAPSDESGGLWLAAYPLEARDYIAPAERESQIPELFLQALSREESAFDDQVVSWAGAYGLTQLLLSTGQTAGRLLDPPVLVTEARQLLDPGLNARLGAAYLGRLLERYDGHPALALAAYNAGEGVADTWWRRHAGDDLDHFAEAMTIKETRGYVKRVLRTYGIYRWLYAGEPAVLPAAQKLPQRQGPASASR